MQKMWAPWRMEYIRQEKRSGCFLCRIIRGRKDRESLLLQRGKTCFLVMNRYPYNNGHLMVATRRHIAELTAMTSAERSEMMEMANFACRVLKREMRPHGFNVGLNLGAAGGAGLKEHIHLHIVPRWNGDTNFMPVVSGVKVIPQALDDLWTRLRARLDEGNVRERKK